jgi:hypothetical protein
MVHTPSDGHDYPNREDTADLEQRCRFSSEGVVFAFVLIYISAMARVGRDGTGGAWDVKHKLCDTLGARMSDIVRSTEGDARERVGDL